MPMCEASLENILTQMPKGALVLEQHYPGEHVQIHKLGDCIVVFGAGQEDLTASLGQSCLAELRTALTCRACVLEAALLRDTSEVAAVRPFFVAWDCLWLDGRSLTGRTLGARRAALNCAVKG